jgi:hypothetical protein
MRVRRAHLLTVLFSLGIRAAAAAPPAAPPTISVPLTISSGVPLRLYIPQRLRMHQGELVHARLIDPIYAFDRVVVPEGVEVLGHITSFERAPKLVRTEAILGGDFTPLHAARVEFTTVLMPDGSHLEIHTAYSLGLDSIYVPPPPSKKQNGAKSPAGKKSGAVGAAKQQINAGIRGQITARSRGLADLIHGPHKLERLEDLLITKLPYHPQWYPRGTRFDAVLREPLNFGDAAIPVEALQAVGLEPAEASTGHVRLLETVSSASAQKDDKVQGVLSQPLLSPEDRLVLPEGTRLTGTVRQVRRARWFHRSGHLRFTFDQVELPAFSTVPPHPVPRAEAQLQSVEGGDQAGVTVDPEGNAKVTESKARLLGPLIAVLAATKSLDNDSGKAHQASGTASGNYAGRAAGGFSGFGLLGVLAARGSRNIGSALGFYGLAWSVYATIISRGQEVRFPQNTVMEVQFGPRAPAVPAANGNHFARVLPP